MFHKLSASQAAPRRAGARVLSIVTVLAVTAGFQGCGGGSGNTSDIHPIQALLHWNQIALDAAGADHASASPEQFGPCRAARAMAIVHVAMFETMVAINGGYTSYLNLAPPTGRISQSVAIAQAAHDTLTSLFPAQAMTFDDALADDLDLVEDGTRKNNGIAMGQASASAILGMRFNDGSQVPDPMIPGGYVPGNSPGEWRQDPVSMFPLAVGADWPQVLPFLLTSGSQFRAPAPPALTDPAYTAAYDQVKAIGGDGVTTPSTRTPDQSVIGIYWAYDATPALCAPPRLYNQIAVLLGTQQNLQDMEFGRLLALTNMALADAALAAWDSKYFYDYWRPIAGIRESDPGTGPSGLGDGNAATVGDMNWTPLGAPASNTNGPNFTPPFPSYPSGHATLGGSCFQVLRRFFDTDSVPFTFVSDEFNGVTLDNMGNPRPLLPRTFSTFTQAEEENGQSRIYLGIHWAFDKTAGITMGNDVGNWVFDHIYQPLP